MPELGRKYTCYSCHTKFYDLGKPAAVCPKCGADQKDADDAPAYTAPRSRRVVAEVPEEEEEVTPARPQSDDADEEEEFSGGTEREEESADDEEEEEY